MPGGLSPMGSHRVGHYTRLVVVVDREYVYTFNFLPSSSVDAYLSICSFVIRFYKFLLEYFILKRWAVYTVKTMSSSIFPRYNFILNYFFPVGLTSLEHLIVLLPGNSAFTTVG